MSLEVKIEALTKAVIGLTDLIAKIEAGKTEPVKAAPEPIIKVVVPEPVAAPVTAPVVDTTPSEVAPVMPAPPIFAPVAEAPAGPVAPFSDGKGLIEYVMNAYKEMGAEKGAKIQGVLVELGVNNVNEVKPELYGTFFAKVEALK